MSIVLTDLKIYLSGGASNSDPNDSLGGAISSTEFSDNSLNNLFDDVTGDEHTAGDTEYRAVFFTNSSAETAYNVKVWIYSNTTAADDTMNIGVESSVGSPIQTVTDETTAPVGISFSTADGQANAITIGSLLAGESIGVWFKRIVTAGSTAAGTDTSVFYFGVDTL